MLVRVPTVQTKFNIADFTKAFIVAWYSIYNAVPTKQQVAVVYAQWGLETGIGTYCWNFNIGNAKAVDSPSETIQYCVLNGTWEMVNGVKVILTPNDPGSWFRAFDSLSDGMTFHLNLLRNQRYRTAWSAVEAGDPALFSLLLKEHGYYTASETSYFAAMNYYFKKFMADPTYEAVAEGIVETNDKVEFPSDFQPLGSVRKVSLLASLMQK